MPRALFIVDSGKPALDKVLLAGGVLLPQYAHYMLCRLHNVQVPHKPLDVHEVPRPLSDLCVYLRLFITTILCLDSFDELPPPPRVGPLGVVLAELIRVKVAELRCHRLPQARREAPRRPGRNKVPAEIVADVIGDVIIVIFAFGGAEDGVEGAVAAGHVEPVGGEEDGCREVAGEVGVAGADERCQAQQEVGGAAEVQACAGVERGLQEELGLVEGDAPPQDHQLCHNLVLGAPAARGKVELGLAQDGPRHVGN